MKPTRGPIETLCRDLHAELLRVIQPSSDVQPMTWPEFQEKANLAKWDRHLHWKLKEGELKWGPDRLIETARKLGVPVVVAVGKDAESLLRPPPVPAPPARRGRKNAPDPRQFSLFGTNTPTECAA